MGVRRWSLFRCSLYVARSARALRRQVPPVPGQVTLQPVPDVARRGDAVVLAGVDHELRVDAEAPQRLIHLLAADDRDVEVRLAAEVEGRRLDAVGVEERVGHPDPRLETLPGRAELLLVL